MPQSRERRTCAFLPCLQPKPTGRTSIASFLYQLYCQRECVCVRCILKSRRNASFPPDANGSLCAKEKTQRNKIKLQNSNQLISARFISFLLWSFVSAMLFPLFRILRTYRTHIFAERHRVRNILHLGLRCTYTYEFYYMPIRHICNVRFNFFVFNLSPWPFLDRAPILLEVSVFLYLFIYLVVEEILIKFYFVCQRAAIYGASKVKLRTIRFLFWLEVERAKNPLWIFNQKTISVLSYFLSSFVFFLLF